MNFKSGINPKIVKLIDQCLVDSEKDKDKNPSISDVKVCIGKAIDKLENEIKLGNINEDDIASLHSILTGGGPLTVKAYIEYLRKLVSR